MTAVDFALQPPARLARLCFLLIACRHAASGTLDRLRRARSSALSHRAHHHQGSPPRPGACMVQRASEPAGSSTRLSPQRARRASQSPRRPRRGAPSPLDEAPPGSSRAPPRRLPRSRLHSLRHPDLSRLQLTDPSCRARPGRPPSFASSKGCGWTTSRHCARPS